ncbi:MAG: aminotransferase class I/II-fold pyridoxal phosphate-dependent enzyme [Desulfovibrionaceae bacterium]|nr:aminotransferase class I/II-fold pyridoxal phosphate-dependent enzyme [Desulfovibrionaceae bacterium]
MRPRKLFSNTRDQASGFSQPRIFMTERKSFGLTAELKASLLAKMQGQAKDNKAQNAQPERALERVIDPSLVSFSSLPAYTQLEVQKAVAKKLNLTDPYYQCHEGLSQNLAVINGQTYLNFSCYDYLGLNGDQRIAAAINLAVQKYGSSASASRLTAGERPPHRALEEGLAHLYGVEDCLCFVSGHATNVSTIECLFGPQDAIFYDVRSHNSLVLGAKASGAARFAYPNNDMVALRRLLLEHRDSFKRILLVTEGLFGMDGCICDLPGLIALKKEFGCFLMVDEAHSIGTLGARGAGVADYFGLSTKEVDIWMGTLSKTFCGCGGYIAGTSVLIELLKYEAPGFVYSVGMAPMLASASKTALDIMCSEPWRVQKLQENSQTALKLAQSLGLDTGQAQGYAVIPIMLGDSLTCVLAAKLLREAGILVLPIIYPGVEEGKARLRFFISALHTKEQLTHAFETTAQIVPKARQLAAQFA